MSNTKTVMSQAANTLVTPLNVEDVFSTYLYEGNGSTQTITNGIDLDGEGGLVWIKNRDYTYAHMLHDTEATGVENVLRLPNTSGISYDVDTLTSFNSDGFTVGDDSEVNENGTGWTGHASWTFRKAPKFFDVVTYTGDGTSSRAISHNLGCEVGAIFVKSTSAAGNWAAYHKETGAGSLFLNLTNAHNQYDTTVFNTAATSTEFTVGNSSHVNNSGNTYVAYLFAHNDGDGDFGPTGDADIIKCGSYTGNGSTDGPEIDLGFEPQWFMWKRTDATANWAMIDNMRGISYSDPGDPGLFPNEAYAENPDNNFNLTATGLKCHTNNSEINASGGNYIYMAIRRGPLAVPEDATDVFDVQFNGGNDPSKAPVYQSGFVTDMAIVGYRTGGSANYPYTGNRLMGIQTLETHNTDAEEAGGTSFQWDFMNGFIDSVPSVITDTQIAWMWKRAPGYFDVVAYTGSGANTVINHNLDAIPEMVWVKNRGRSVNWNVYHKDLELNGDPASECRLFLHTYAAVSSGAVFWGTHTNTTFTMTVQNFQTNYPNDTYIAYLFATLDGISKVGSYTGNGSSQTIDCGFTSGARFILIKRTDSTGDWYVWDTERGIVAGNDPYLELNTTDAEVTSTDWVDPDNSGFIVNGTTINASSAEYIFYAIA